MGLQTSVIAAHVFVVERLMHAKTPLDLSGIMVCRVSGSRVPIPQ